MVTAKALNYAGCLLTGGIPVRQKLTGQVIGIERRNFNTQIKNIKE